MRNGKRVRHYTLPRKICGVRSRLEKLDSVTKGLLWAALVAWEKRQGFIHEFSPWELHKNGNRPTKS